MMSDFSWRSPLLAEHYKNHDYADFAQEFLRRNAEYRRDYADTHQRIADDPEIKIQEVEGLAGRWGLQFPLRS
jgi:ABC-type sulfate transport system substrate-binding protein